MTYIFTTVANLQVSADAMKPLVRGGGGGGGA